MVRRSADVPRSSHRLKIEQPLEYDLSSLGRLSNDFDAGKEQVAHGQAQISVLTSCCAVHPIVLRSHQREAPLVHNEPKVEMLLIESLERARQNLLIYS